MMNMNILAVVTPPSIYHGCSALKTFWEEKFTYEEELTLGEFTVVNINNCGPHRTSSKCINHDK